MIAIIDTILPVFALLALGYLAARFRYVSEATQKGLPEFVFRVAIPVLLFRMIAITAMPSIPAVSILLSFFGACVVVWITMTLLSVKTMRFSIADAGVHAFAAGFSNVLMLGIPLTLSYFGDKASPVLVLILFVDATLFWVVGSLQVALGEGAGFSRLPAIISSVLRKLLTNPVIIGVAAGLLWRIGGLPMPHVLDRMSTMLAGAVGATALFAIGMALNAYSLKGAGGMVGLITGLKLLLQPAVAWFIAIPLLGMPADIAMIVIMLAALPVGGNAYLFSTAMKRQEGVVSGAIALSTPLAIVTLSALLLWFR